MAEVVSLYKQVKTKIEQAQAYNKKGNVFQRMGKMLTRPSRDKELFLGVQKLVKENTDNPVTTSVIQEYEDDARLANTVKQVSTKSINESQRLIAIDKYGDDFRIVEAGIETGNKTRTFEGTNQITLIDIPGAYRLELFIEESRFSCMKAKETPLTEDEYQQFKKDLSLLKSEKPALQPVG